MGRAPCCDKNGLKKGPWTPEEDQNLIQYIQKHGHGSWRTLPKNAGLARCGKSCRLRWTNYLRPDIKRGRFSFEEEETIIQLHSILGNKWSAIAARLPGRTDNEIKNYWNTHIRKRLLRMGIDPVTHSPRLDLLDLSSVLGSSSLYNPNHVNFSRLLGLEPLVMNSELLRLATGIGSSNSHPREDPSFPQTQISDTVPENLECLSTPGHIQNSLSSLQTPLPDFQACTTTNTTPFFSETQLMQPPNVLQRDEMLSKSCNFGHQSYETYCDIYQSIMDPLPQSSNFQLNTIVQNSNFIPALLTPQSSPAQLHSSSSSSTYMSSSGNTTPLNSSSTYFNSGIEDDRDSYCSDMLRFEMPVLLDPAELL